MSRHVPATPCPDCGGEKFSVLDDGWFELLSEKKKKLGTCLYPRFRLRVCAGCGHTAFFDKDGRDGIAETEICEPLGERGSAVPRSPAAP